MNVEESMLLSASPTLGPRLKPELCSWTRCPGIIATILVTISCLVPSVSSLELQSSDDNPTDQYMHPIITFPIHYKLSEQGVMEFDLMLGRGFALGEGF